MRGPGLTEHVVGHGVDLHRGARAAESLDVFVDDAVPALGELRAVVERPGRDPPGLAQHVLGPEHVEHALSLGFAVEAGGVAGADLSLGEGREHSARAEQGQEAQGRLHGAILPRRAEGLEPNVPFTRTQARRWSPKGQLGPSGNSAAPT